MKYDPGDLIHLGGDVYIFVTHKYIVEYENRKDWHYIYYNLNKPNAGSPAIQSDLFEALVKSKNGVVVNVNNTVSSRGFSRGHKKR